MKKKLMSIFLMLVVSLTLVIPASAADVVDTVGKIYCDVMPHAENNPKTEWDYFSTSAKAIVSGRTAGETMNIYVRAYVMSPDRGTTYQTKQSTEHYKTTTSATTPKEGRSWYAEGIKVQSVGIARARYTNNRISEDTRGGQTTTIGGRYTRGAFSVPFEQETNVQKVTLGLDKGENMAAVIRDVFGHDLSAYQYVSFAELWDETQVTSATQPIRRILIDTCMEIQAGENMPLGYLYQGNTVYTVVEQPDGSLQLTQYEVQPAPMIQSANGTETTEVLPDYRVVETESRAVNQASVEALYE